MSSCPGYTLEEYVAWEHNLVVENLGEVNFSLGVATMLGNCAQRPVLDEETFKEVIAIYEPHREYIENRLEEYDEETSWRSYAGCAFDDIPDECFKQAQAVITRHNPKPGTPTPGVTAVDGGDS